MNVNKNTNNDSKLSSQYNKKPSKPTDGRSYLQVASLSLPDRSSKPDVRVKEDLPAKKGTTKKQNNTSHVPGKMTYADALKNKKTKDLLPFFSPIQPSSVIASVNDPAGSHKKNATKQP